MAFEHVSPYTYENNLTPIAHTVPFTYRDGMTFLELLKSFQSYINDQLVPQIDNRIDTINEILETEFTKFEDVAQDWQNSFDDFMTNVNAELRALNDDAVTALVNDSASDLRGALDSWFADQFDTASTDFLNTDVDDLIDTKFNSLSTNLVRGDGVARIIASKDVEHPIGDGDLLVTLETPHFFTDFTGYPVDTAPADWSSRWVTSSQFAVENLSTATGGRALHAGLFTEDGERRLLTWDILDSYAQDYGDVELVWKWYVYDLGTPRGVVYSSGSATHEYGLFAGIARNSDADQIGSYRDGSASVFLGNEGEINPDHEEWWITRFRYRAESGGTSARMFSRSWKYGTPEPTEWARPTWVFDELPRGPIGIMFWGGGDTFVDWFGVSFDGGRAPMGW